MKAERFDVIVVGGGPSGASAAYRLAQAGAKVLVIERGHHGGTKNMMGGRIYTHSLEQLIPHFRDIAPLERQVNRERISMISGPRMTSVEYMHDCMNREEDSYVVKRALFDKWLLGEAEKEGSLVITDITVTSLITEGRPVRVTGVRCGNDAVYADLVIIAEGANTMLLEAAKLMGPTQPAHMAVGVKETFKIGKDKLEDRLALGDGLGMAWLSVGDMTEGILGGGFVYTNKDSVTVGLVVGLEELGLASCTIDEMLERFKTHPGIAPVIKGGQLEEHSAHMVPEGGYDSMPRLGGDGYMVVGDAARMCMNLGYTIRGMDLAIGSGMVAADAFLQAKRDHRYDLMGQYYTDAIEHSWIGQDMQLYKGMPAFLRDGKDIFGTYPMVVNGLMHDVFAVNGDGATSIMKKVFHRVLQLNPWHVMKDGWKGVRSL